MKVINGLENLRTPLDDPVVTVGNFDGVHRGHQALFAKVRELAAEHNGTATAMTFEPHPMRVLRPAVNLPLITPLEQKLALFNEFGMAVGLCVRFDEDFARLSADVFVDKLLAGRIKAKAVVVGHDFHFGRKGLGDIELLQTKAETLGFSVHQVGPVMVEGEPVSSTRVRQRVRACDLKTARHLLGRHYRIAGKVITGKGRGARLLGFPTANLKVTDELLPGAGVYAVLVETDNGGLHQGATNIGSNPTFNDDGTLHVETHLLDFEGDLYGQPIKVHFVEHLRPEKKFNSPEELAGQINRDITRAREVLGPWQDGDLDPYLD